MKYLTLIVLSLSGCGAVQKYSARITGDAYESCQNGVAYLQFTSGAAVAYNKDGTVKTCN